MGLSAHIRKHAFSIPGKLQLVHMAFAKALEVIPRQICDNGGLDSTDILNKLRMRHANGQGWFGVDVDGPEGVRDNMEAFVWEPSLVKINAINSATEAASLILSVDETVRNPQSGNVSVQVYTPDCCHLTKILPRLARRRTSPATGRRSESVEGTRPWYAKTVDRICICTNISRIISLQAHVTVVFLVAP